MDEDKITPEEEVSSNEVPDTNSVSPSVSSVQKGTLTHKMRENPWVAATLVLGIFAIIMLVANFGSLTGGAITGGAISNTDAGTAIMNFANSQGANATLVSIEDQDTFYKVTLSIEGKDLPVYVTKDGKYFTASLIPLTEDSTSTNTPTTPTNSDAPVEIPIGNSPVMGDENAPLTIVEVSDLSCPFCAANVGVPKMVSYMQSKSPSWKPAMPGIIKDYVNTGKAKLVYKYSMGHSGAHPATLVAWCLNEQGLFWEMHDAAFENQADVEDLAKMKALAKTIGADMTKLQTCLDSKKYDSKFDEDQTLVRGIGVTGTPAIYANGIKVANGAESYTDVKTKIDAILASL